VVALLGGGKLDLNPRLEEVNKGLGHFHRKIRNAIRIVIEQGLTEIEN
jgi:hypothetical protein